MSKNYIWKVISAILSFFMSLVLINSLLSYEVIALNNKVMNIQTVIVVIFGFEYIYNFIVSENKKEYLIHNIISLMSIIPINIYVYVLKLAGINKYFTISRQIDIVILIMLAIYLLRFNSIVKELWFKNKIIYMFVLTGIVIVLGALSISIVENISIGDAMWWSFVTFTTVGYGDVTLYTPLGRVIGVMLMIVGIGVIGVLTSTIAIIIFFGKSEKNNQSYRDETIDKAIERIRDFESLTEEELECIFTSLISLKKKKK